MLAQVDPVCEASFECECIRIESGRTCSDDQGVHAPLDILLYQLDTITTTQKRVRTAKFHLALIGNDSLDGFDIERIADFTALANPNRYFFFHFFHSLFGPTQLWRAFKATPVASLVHAATSTGRLAHPAARRPGKS